MSGRPFGYAAENPAWAGGTSVSSGGYRLVRAPEHPAAMANGYVYEHRLVAEAVLGRPLTSDEVVLLRDENRLNTDPSNLIITTRAGLNRLRTNRSGPRRRRRRQARGR